VFENVHSRLSIQPVLPLIVALVHIYGCKFTRGSMLHYYYTSARQNWNVVSWGWGLGERERRQQRQAHRGGRLWHVTVAADDGNASIAG